MKTSRLILFSVLLSLLISTPGFTYSGDTHEKLNEKALKISIINSYLKNNLSFSKGIEEKISGESGTKTVEDWIKGGGRTEDEPKKRCKNHFHNPLKPWNEAGLSDIFSGDSSILWAQNIDQEWSWKNAREYYYLALTSETKEERDKNFANMFRSLGQVMHLIEDSSVPAHSRNDTHLLYNYESYLEELQNSKKPSDVALFNSFLDDPIEFDKKILKITPNSLAPIPIARIVDTDEYRGTNPGVGVGNNIGLSEYTNINFLGRDTMFTRDFPHPAKGEVELWTDTANGKQYLRKKDNAKGEKVEHLAVRRWKYWYRIKHFPKPLGYLPIGLDEKCYKEYATNLVPRAAGYSAGLLNYFFRGKLDFELKCIEYPYLEFVITNKSSETITGTLALYWDDKNGNRSKEDEWSVDLAPGGATYPTYTLPDNAIRCIWVFRGTLGNESPETEEAKGAVIGKVVELGPMSYHILQNPPYAGIGSPPPISLMYQAHFGEISLSLIDSYVTDWIGDSYPHLYVFPRRNFVETYRITITPDNPADSPFTYLRDYSTPQYKISHPTWHWYGVTPKNNYAQPRWCNATITADGVQTMGNIIRQYEHEDNPDIARHVLCVYINNIQYHDDNVYIPPAGSHILIYGWEADTEDRHEILVPADPQTDTLWGWLRNETGDPDHHLADTTPPRNYNPVKY